MASKETILTADGLKKLQEELAQRKGEIREEIVERLKEARAQGDLSENSEYDQAKEDQGKNEGRILELEQMIKTATSSMTVPAKQQALYLLVLPCC